MSGGYILKCTLTGADPGASLQAMNSRGIRLTRIQRDGELTVRFHCSGKNRKTIEQICSRRGDSVHFAPEPGLLRVHSLVFCRPVLLVGCVMFFVLTLFLPTRVLFFQVEGNETIPRRQILEAAAECGIRFGASRSRVRSEKMKNALLAAMPQLKWAGINTSGCTAVISVRERQPEPRQSVSGNVSSIAACRDGYITSCTVTKGNLLCAPGQIVQAGQVLISGFTDCGICIQATQAQGEIYAQTRRELTLKWLPLHYIRRSEGETRRRYSLILGKNRINLWKGSGISGSSCGRMYEEYYITLPGGFRLPIRIGVETLTAWSIQEESLDVLSLEPQIQEWARQLTLNDAVAGRILGETHDFSREGSLRCHFLCEEMIGRVITEEIGEANGKTD